MSKIQNSNRKKLNAAVLTLIILSSLTFIAVAFATGEQIGEKQNGEGIIPETPGVPDNAIQYNKTDVTPVAQMEQVKAGEPALFCYRNTTMLMNCSQNCDFVVTVDPEVKPKLLGISIEPNQTMTLTMNLSSSPLEGAKVMEQTLNFYWGIEPNATLQLRGQLRVHINQTELSQELNREVNASRLTWMYWNKTQNQWQEAQSYMDQNGYLVCNTDHFSTWTVAEFEIETRDETTENNFDASYIIAGVAAVFAVVVAIGIVKVKKRR